MLAEHDSAIFYDMADALILPMYSIGEIKRAGETIARRDLQRDEATIHAFRVAHNWRDSHNYPLMKIRGELVGRVRGIQRPGSITAARMKRMQSIRKKLQNINTDLTQIQDLGGCRAVVETMTQVKALIQRYQDGDTAHHVRRQTSYIDAPKNGGYRSHHIIFNFRGGPGFENFEKHRIELQIRTELQHSWATAVEAVGLFRNEDLKGGRGDGDWLRLFELMSAQFAEIECEPLVPNTPVDKVSRVSELKDLNRKLRAINTLDNINNAIRYAPTYARNFSAVYYLIQYDNSNNTVTVRPYANYQPSSEQYYQDEQDKPSRNTVLVEVDKVDDLKAAYPNYFLDVKKFMHELRMLVDQGYGAWQQASRWFRPAL